MGFYVGKRIPLIGGGRLKKNQKNGRKPYKSDLEKLKKENDECLPKFKI